MLLKQFSAEEMYITIWWNFIQHGHLYIILIKYAYLSFPNLNCINACSNTRSSGKIILLLINKYKNFLKITKVAE